MVLSEWLRFQASYDNIACLFSVFMQYLDYFAVRKQAEGLAISLKSGYWGTCSFSPFQCGLQQTKAISQKIEARSQTDYTWNPTPAAILL
ncbi:hypothetical protein U1Q18_012786, partial [Sarracenia purpurea var. burkii]